MWNLPFKLPFKLPRLGIAYAYYSPALHKAQPASTYAYGHKQSFWSNTCTVNIVWYGLNPWAGVKAFEKDYPDITLRGTFLTGRQLASIQVGLGKVSGPPAPVWKQASGPLTRSAPKPSSMAVALARRRLIRLASVRGEPDDSGPDAA